MVAVRLVVTTDDSRQNGPAENLTRVRHSRLDGWDEVVVIAVPLGVFTAALFMQCVEARLDRALAAVRPRISDTYTAAGDA